MSEVAKAVKPLFDKFIDFFDIFDLSFFVAGATFIAAIAWASLTPSLPELVGLRKLSTGESVVTNALPGVTVFMLILASYVSGMTCFALGRFSRSVVERVRNWVMRVSGRNIKNLREYKRTRLHEELVQHGVLERDGDEYRVRPGFDRMPWLQRYFLNGGRGQEAALYVRLWAEVRQRERFAPSFSLVRRYWVSTATLDGLFIALGTWAVLLYLVDQSTHGLVPTVATGLGAVFCMREAGRYDVYQREELIASLLHAYDLPDDELEKAMASPPPPPAERDPARIDARREPSLAKVMELAHEDPEPIEPSVAREDVDPPLSEETFVGHPARRTLIGCPGCGRQVSPRAKACPSCAFPIAEHLAEQQAATEAKARLATREQLGEADCPHCEARGFRMFEEKDDEGELKRVFSWCHHCEHSGRVHLCRDSAGYYAVSLPSLEAYLAGELPDEAEEIVFIGAEAPAEHRYEQAGERFNEDGSSKDAPGDEANEDSEGASEDEGQSSSNSSKGSDEGRGLA